MRQLEVQVGVAIFVATVCCYLICVFEINPTDVGSEEKMFVSRVLNYPTVRGITEAARRMK